MRKIDLEELKNMNAENWMIECLKKNPEYVWWGNFEDYMCKEGSGWDSRVNCDTAGEGLWGLDELNEVVNFYFEIIRDSEPCEHCDQTGYNQATKELSDSWYSFNNPSKAWQYSLTEIEIKALVKAGRLTDLMEFNCHYDEQKRKWFGWINGVKQEIEEPKYPTPEEVNKWARKGFGHDAINKSIAVRTRAEHLGVYGHCEHCNSKGYIYTTDKARLALQLWFLHPRKGCSRGVYIKNIQENEVPKVIEYLKHAAQRNAERFSKL